MKAAAAIHSALMGVANVLSASKVITDAIATGPTARMGLRPNRM